MTRHPNDKPRSQAGARLREYLRQERQSGLHPAVRALIARPTQPAKAGRKLVEFARIARGRLA